MAKPFDITTKQIVDADPLACVRFLGLPGSSVRLLDTDLAMSSQADRLLEVADPNYLVHLELQAAYHADMGERVLYYSVAARRKFGALVRSVVLLLRKEADGPAMSGRVTDESIDFRFQVVRLWDLAPDLLLNAPLTLLPLAPLTNVAESEIPAVIEQMRSRLDSEGTSEYKDTFWGATTVLLGLRLKPDVARALVRGVWSMQESTVYQSILAEGEARGEARGKAIGKAIGERELILIVGSKRFGDPDANIRMLLDAIESPERLKNLGARLLDVDSWHDLLAS